MGTLIHGKEIASNIIDSLEKQVAILRKKKRIPSLVVVLVGNNPASCTYVRMKGQVAKKIGMQFTLVEYPKKVTTKKLVSEIHRIQEEQTPSGMILQLPLPSHIDTTAALNTIDPIRDIDCLTFENIGRLVMKQARFFPPTANAAMKILENFKVSIPGKNVTIVGVGPLVGKPLAVMLMNERASVTTVNSATKNFKEKCRAADIIITAVGKQNTIRGDMVRDGTIVIDAGIDFTPDGKVIGDVNVKEVARHALAVTPTPGGVGPLTIACLLENTVIAANIT
ncbi:bifunctional 5,10-methylenetetrahydrofolate dehydrogenase/5,10-methenyltetrahydrofolate cyclohydrolase [Candidatus Uhrbacteria bacterium]|nr:bifunctional 5,10-methylenetetrahydrofolate dehydrogenase/5,10-methenyltetrahydrofolate cyclohydrolase [Candidatus Uhrbacteria bacterium]